MLEHLNRFNLDSQEWGQVQVLRPIPIDGDIWGDFATLKDTDIGKLIPIVSGEALSNALHGYVTPLMNEIGPHPHGLLKQIPEKYRTCQMFESCIMYDLKVCFPCPKLPACYVPPEVSSINQEALAIIILAWAEGRYVILVEGEEFSLG